MLPYLLATILTAFLELGVDVFGWMEALVLGAGCGVLGCLTADADIGWLALEGRLLERGRTCITEIREESVAQDNLVLRGFLCDDSTLGSTLNGLFGSAQ